jgi:hypothetical protein
MWPRSDERGNFGSIPAAGAEHAQAKLRICRAFLVGENRVLGDLRSTTYLPYPLSSLHFFGGLRARVAERDRFRCRGCGKGSARVDPLPYTNPSLVGMEMLVLRDAGEIMTRIASEGSSGASADHSKC